MSLSVPNPKLDLVLDMLSGKEVSAHKAIGNEYEPALLVRNEAMETFLAGRPRYACPFCTRGLRLNGMLASKRFYFRHAKELGDCPIDTRGRLSREEIDAIRYNGAKESALHFQMKHWIAQCIEADSGLAHRSSRAPGRAR